jgi:hypothetical protein
VASEGFKWLLVTMGGGGSRVALGGRIWFKGVMGGLEGSVVAFGVTDGLVGLQMASGAAGGLVGGKGTYMRTDVQMYIWMYIRMYIRMNIHTDECLE